MKSLIVVMCMLWSSISYAGTVVSTYTGGYLGFASIGLGVVSPEKSYQANAVLGYVPSIVGGENLWSLSVRGDVSFTSWQNGDIRLYGGAGLLTSLDKDTFILLPSKYPSGYYPSTGLLFSPYVGTEWMISNRSALCLEVTSLDFYLELYVRNPDYLTIRDITTYGIGYKYYLP